MWLRLRSALNSWVAAGNAPPSSPRLEITEATAPTFVKDAVGNTKGGIRSPWVRIPMMPPVCSDMIAPVVPG